jgi:peptide-methionine (R)-S-oxide reductase
MHTKRRVSSFQPSFASPVPEDKPKLSSIPITFGGLDDDEASETPKPVGGTVSGTKSKWSKPNTDTNTTTNKTEEVTTASERPKKAGQGLSVSMHTPRTMKTKPASFDYRSTSAAPEKPKVKPNIRVGKVADQLDAIKSQPQRGEKSFSFLSPKGNRPTLGVKAKSFVERRHDKIPVDGKPMSHWAKDNFELKRDASCRMVYEPTDPTFFEKTLNPEEYKVLRNTSIEAAYFSKYNRFFPGCGHFCCKACGNALYCCKAKFNAFNGWPAFGACVEGSIGWSTESEFGPDIVEIHCHRCKSHLGNVVEEENKTQYGTFIERHRVNGQAIKYVQDNLSKNKMTEAMLLYPDK